jgi:Kef-type K+ transport system membrane component KefB
VVDGSRLHPRGRVMRELQRQLEPFAVVLLLPMFFTFSGLKTRLDLAGNPQMLAIAAAGLRHGSVGRTIGRPWESAR